MEYSTPYTPLLVACYVLLVILACYQILLIHCHGHKLLSFNVGFLWLCVIFCTFRVVFWLVSTPDAPVYYFLYWLPINIQFGMFYLVMLYIMRLVFKAEKGESKWDQRAKALVFWTSIAINAVLLLATAAWLVYCTCSREPGVMDISATCQSTHMIFAGVCFVTLALSLLFYGVKLHIIESRVSTPNQSMQTSHSSSQINYPIQGPVRWGPNESRFRTEGICFSLLTVFITRAVFEFIQLDSTKALAISGHPLGKDITNIEVFVMYFVWEIFPTLLMLIFFGSAVTAAGASSVTQQHYLHRATLTSYIGAHADAAREEQDSMENIVEEGAPNVYWPLPKEVVDAAGVGRGRQASKSGSLRGGANPIHQSHTPVGWLEEAYDSPHEDGFSSPLQWNTGANQAVSRGYQASQGIMTFSQPVHLAFPSQQGTAAGAYNQPWPATVAAPTTQTLGQPLMQDQINTQTQKTTAAPAPQ